MGSHGVYFRDSCPKSVFEAASRAKEEFGVQVR